MQTAEYEIMFRVEETHWWYRALHELIFQQLDTYLPDWKQQSILDAGCGTGAILQRLGNPEKHVGLDLSEHALTFCRQRGLDNVVSGDVQQLPFPDQSFSAVISSSVLYHQWVPDIPRALREAHRVLKENGIVILNLPACKSLHSAHDEAVLTARRFNAAEVRQLVETSGLEIIRLTHWTSFLFPAVWLARSGLLRAGRDFNRDQQPSRMSNAVMGSIMRMELAVLKRMSLPFGVSILCVARKK